LTLFPAMNTAREIAYTKFRTDGLGYRSAKWRDLEVGKAVQQETAPFTAGTRIYSDAADVLFLYSERTIYNLPPTALGNDRALADLHKSTSVSNGLIVFVLVNPTYPDQISETSVRSSSLFRLVATFKDG